LRFDPAGHRDLIAARDASLGGGSAFVKLIRIIKHLNQRWADQHGNVPVTSFHIEALALTLCSRPFTLAEGVTDFLREGSRLVHVPLNDPLATADSIVAEDPVLAADLFAEAAKLTEQALMTAGSRVDHLLSEVFGRPDELVVEPVGNIVG
jgi:hypothetical protein